MTGPSVTDAAGLSDAVGRRPDPDPVSDPAGWREEYELRRYVSDRQGEAVSANSCDYRATGQPELDRIEDRARRLRAAYLGWLPGADPDVLRGCAALWDVRGFRRHSAHELAEISVGADHSRHSPGGRTLLGPACHALYDDCFRLREAMRPTRAGQAFDSGERP
jgi:hypothetical protein